MAMGQLPVFIKFYWSTAMHICLCIVYGFFHTTMAELNSLDGDCLVHKD